MAADGSKWRYVVTNADGSAATTGGQSSGQVFNASNKTFSYHINTARTASFDMTTDNPRASFILNNDRVLGKVYRKNRLGNWQLLLCGDLLVTDEKGSGNVTSVTCTIIDPLARLNSRLVGVSKDDIGRGIGFNLFSATSPGNLGAGWLFVIATLQGISPMTGINGGTFDPGIHTGFIGPLYGVQTLDEMQQVSATVGGPDFEVVPQEPSGSMPAVIMSTIHFYSHLGTAAPTPGVEFEYGVGKKNIASYELVRTRSNFANNVVSLPQGYPTAVAQGDTIVVYFDVGSLAAVGEWDHLANEDLVSQPLRLAFCQNAAQVLMHPQVQLSFIPTVDNPMDYTVDYNVGDVVTARAFDIASNTMRFNGSARVYGVSMAIDDNDSENCTLTLVPGTN